ncbi:MAG: hypothetical protein ACRDLL_07220 [Solirubrobacterales bacterium]
MAAVAALGVVGCGAGDDPIGRGMACIHKVANGTMHNTSSDRYLIVGICEGNYGKNLTLAQAQRIIDDH